MKFSFRLITILCLLLGAIVPTLHAQDMGAVRDRMVQRLSTVDSLKADGAIGENNRGFLEVRSAGEDAAKVVAAENADREIVYAAIAKQTGSSAAQVAQARARQIASGSASGVWLQNASGSWYQK
tara:strand:- start:367 stop:741 length:375 start_codon:yes stop_codon:yes gene_type:complete